MKPIIHRKGGAVVGRRSNFYHRVFHDRVQAKLELVTLVEAGVYVNFRNYAGGGHFDGTIWHQAIERMTIKDCTAWVARKLAGEGWRERTSEARAILERLKEVTLLTWGRDSVVHIVDFASEQYQAPTPGAQRTREYRGRRDADRELSAEASAGAVDSDGGKDSRAGRPGDGVPPPAAPPAPPPTSPASTPTFDTTGPDGPSGGFGFAYGVTRDAESVTSDDRLISKSKVEKGDYVTSKSKVERENGADRHKAPTGLRPMHAGEVGGGDIYAMHPVDAAVFLTGERNQWAVNGFNRALQRVGRDEFTMALGEFKQALQDGIQPRSSPGAFFHGILKKREQRMNP